MTMDTTKASTYYRDDTPPGAGRLVQSEVSRKSPCLMSPVSNHLSQCLQPLQPSSAVRLLSNPPPSSPCPNHTRPDVPGAGGWWWPNFWLIAKFFPAEKGSNQESRERKKTMPAVPAIAADC